MGKPHKKELENCFQMQFTEHQMNQFNRYEQLLKQWSKRVRLISKGDLNYIWDRHIVDCLNYLLALPSEGRVLDFGSGAGLPGIILSISRPKLEFELLEPARMKALFLRHVIDELALENVKVLRMRSEELQDSMVQSKDYDWITARAVAPLPKLFDLTKKLLGINGTLVTLKGPNAEEEFEGAIPNDVWFEKEKLTHSLLVRERALVRLRHVSRET